VHQPAAQFYDRFVESIKKHIRTAQIKAALAANAQLVLHYWEIGCDILASQKREGWGAKVHRPSCQRPSAGVSEALWLLRSQSQIHARLLPRPARTVKLCTSLVHNPVGIEPRMRGTTSKLARLTLSANVSRRIDELNLILAT
jgi:hypothetical protein